jgi:enamine deaminase RidA (YjgF/YER057c/UK114 family)
VANRIVVRGGMTQQVRTAWAKIGAILDAAGLGLESVVRVVEYLRLEDVERYAEAAAVRRARK